MENKKIEEPLLKDNSTKKKMSTVLWALSVLSVIAAGLILSYFLFSGKNKVAGVKNLPKKVTDSIIGNYEFVQDSDGSTPNEEAKITLDLRGDGSAYLLAVQPEDRVESFGQYKIESNKIDITFYSLDKKAKEASYSFDGNDLTLPILMISDGEGSSEWKKIAVGNSMEGGQIYLEYLLSQGEGQEESAKKVMAYLKDQDDINDVYATNDWKTITVDYGDSNIKFLISSELHSPSILDFNSREKEKTGANNILDKITPKANAQFLMPGLPGGLSREELLAKRFKLWLENEPEPIQQFDAPLTKKAVVISPVSHYDQSSAMEEQLLELGVIENPSLYGPAIYLRDAGYEVTNEGWVNTLELKDYIRIFTTDYGVIYWSTHGMSAKGSNSMPKTVWLSLGNPRMWEPGDNAKTVVKKYFDYVKNQFNGTGYDAFDFQQSDCFTIDAKGTLLVNAKFIEKLDNDYSDGLVFLDSCYSLWDMSFRDAFGAKAFLGFTGNANIWVANMLSHDFFLDLSKKTRTAREAYDFSWGYVKHKTKIPPLDSSPEFKKFKETAEKTGSETLDRYKLYISGDDSPQLCGADGKFEGLSSSVHGMLIQARKFAVRDSDRSIEGEIGQLMICYTKYWFPGESAALKSPYCHGARVGDPTIEDVRNAQGILGGYKDGRERFTLIE